MNTTEPTPEANPPGTTPDIFQPVTTSGVTRRTFIKRTTATALVTVLALDAFGTEETAEEGCESSIAHFIEIMPDFGFVVHTSTENSITLKDTTVEIPPFDWNGKSVRLYLRAQPVPRTLDADEFEDGTWHYIYSNINIDFTLFASVTENGVERTFRRDKTISLGAGEVPEHKLVGDVSAFGIQGLSGSLESIVENIEGTANPVLGVEGYISADHNTPNPLSGSVSPSARISLKVKKHVGFINGVLTNNGEQPPEDITQAATIEITVTFKHLFGRKKKK